MLKSLGINSIYVRYSEELNGCDGLIIEMHPDPKNSAVDPLQPLNFKQFANLKSRINKLSKIVNKKII